MLSSQTKPWSEPKKILFRIVFIFSVLNVFPFPLYYIPYANYVLTYYYNIWEPIVNLFGDWFFSIDSGIENKSTGSGDTTYSYILYFVCLVFSILGALFWSVLDRKRSDYAWLSNWMVAVLAFWTGTIMLSYGFSKVFYLQFRQPSLMTLMQTYGQSSPMHLMWTFMGASETYTKFAGWSEVIAAVLLFIPRTRTIGGLVTAGVMLNVFMMNMSYDVPVKLNSLNYMITGVIIAAPDFRRILDALVLNRSLSPITRPTLVGRRWQSITLYLLAFSLVAYASYRNIDRSLDRAKTATYRLAEPPLYGVYEAQTYIENGDTIPPLVTDTLRWRYMILDKGSRFNAAVKRLSGDMSYYNVSTDTTERKLEFKTLRDSSLFSLDYNVIADGLVITGVLEQDTVQIKMKRYGREEFLLANRGFHWINEVPYNRYNRKAKIR
ncbi:MAG: hypothetical protein AAFO69_13715 [Bacteroidota bacterium]